MRMRRVAAAARGQVPRPCQGQPCQPELHRHRLDVRPCSIRVAGTTTNLDQTWVILQQAIAGTGSSNASLGLEAAVTIASPPGKAEVEVICASLPRTAGLTTRVVARYRQLDAVGVDTRQESS